MNRFVLLAAVTMPFAALAEGVEVPELRATATATAAASPGRPQGAGMPTEVNAPGETNSVPRTMPPPIVVVSPDRPLPARQQSVVNKAQGWAQRPSHASLDAQGWVHFQYGNGEPFVVCSPLFICDLALQPGEMVTAPPDISDTRWIIHRRDSMEGGQRTIHVIVKPSDAGMQANIVIHTDRRTYSIALTSTARQHMALVRFDYPDDPASGATTAEWSTASPSAPMVSSDPCDQAPSVPPSAFHIDGPNSYWKPIQVFQVATPVGEKTCVQFRADIGSHALPPLIALANDGGWFSSPTPLIVNTRYVHKRYIVDEALDHFALISGVGSDQEKVEVTRNAQ